MQEGDAATAALLFEEAVRWSPDDGTLLHWLGIAYLKLGRFEEAADRLEASLLAGRPPVAGQERVLTDLGAARQGIGASDLPESPLQSFDIQPEPPRWEGRLGLETVRDSNPGLLPEDLSLVTSTGLATAADEAAQLEARLEHHPFHDRSGWSLGLALAGSRSVHRDLDSLDLSSVQGAAQLAWGRDPGGFLAGPLGYTRVPAGVGRVSVLLQAGGSHHELGGDSFLRTVEGAASVTLRPSEKTETRIDLEGWDRTFFDDGPGVFRRSGEGGSLGVHQVLFFGRRDLYLHLGLSVGDQRAGKAFDRGFREASAELALPLLKRWTVYLLGSHRQDRFRNPESNLASPTGPERDDATWSVTASSVWAFDGNLRWTARGSYSRRDSNVDLATGSSLFDYRRTVLSTGIQWSF